MHYAQEKSEIIQKYLAHCDYILKVQKRVAGSENSVFSQQGRLCKMKWKFPSSFEIPAFPDIPWIVLKKCKDHHICRFVQRSIQFCRVPKNCQEKIVILFSVLLRSETPPSKHPSTFPECLFCCLTFSIKISNNQFGFLK